MLRRSSRAPLRVAIASAALAAAALAQSADPMVPLCYSGASPSDAAPWFASNIQGLASDGTYWYVTNADSIWKFPLAMDWEEVLPGAPGVTVRGLDDYKDAAPWIPGFHNHFGDLEYHNFCGFGVLLIPLHAEDHPSTVLALRSSNLQGIDYVELDPATHALAGCLGVDEVGDVYVPGPSYGSFERYSIDCGDLAAGVLSLALEQSIQPTLENGAAFTRGSSQGACFSPAGDLFFYANGYCGDDFCDPDQDGLHVFDTTTWQRIARASSGDSLFRFLGVPDEEPEGMTWIDLDERDVPGMPGQLHVMTLDDDWPSSDDIWVRHYRFRHWVAQSGSLFQSGTRPFPYHTVGQAVGRLWNGSEISIEPGTYVEPITITTRTRIVAPQGGVRIGG